MMQRIRKSLIWFMTALLVCSFLPSGPAQRASAAGAAATYFLPDDSNIRKTAQLTLDGSGGTTIVSRSEVYATMSPTLTITGTFSNVSENSLSVQVQQLSYQNGIWVPVESRVVTGTIQREVGSTNRFVASNLTLFPGFNRIIFTGMQGSVERSDIFYVLYDQVPYIESLTVYGAGATQIQLSEGAQAVSTSQNITLQGQVRNATSVSISLNGGTAIRANLLENGLFSTPTLVLSAGLNQLSIQVANNSDTITSQRQIYLYNPADPYTELKLLVEDPGNAGNYVEYDAFGRTPTVTKGNAAPATNNLKVKLTALLEYKNDVKVEDIGYTLTFGNTIARGNLPNGHPEIIIPGPDGTTPAYRIVQFETAVANIEIPSGSNTLNLSLANGTTIVPNKQIRFNFQPGQTVIQNMYLLPEFSATNNDVSKQQRVPLNGANLNSPNFYILVRTDTAPRDPNGLEGRYLPVGALLNAANNNLVNVTATGTGSNEYVYQITGFASGQHRLNFYYSQNVPYTVSLTFIPKQYIDLPYLRDGETFEFDSRITTNELPISGEYIGFDNLFDAEFFVNGNKLQAGDGSDIVFEPEDGVSRKFTLSLLIRPQGPIVFGQNTLLFTGKTKDSAGNVREVRKELRIYVVDTNVSTIERFHPVVAPSQASSRTPIPNFPLTSADDAAVEAIFRITNEFARNNERYVTSETKYDLVARGYGARYVNLKRGSETVLYLKLPDDPADFDPTDNNYVLINNGLDFDFGGGFDDFILRVKDLVFEEPGTHIYNLELINDTGARTSQRLEIEREQKAYRVVAPQPTVGDQIIVNKNFVQVIIEAEGATAVRVDGEEALKSTDPNEPFHFYYDYTNLRANKWNDIKIEIVRANSNITDTIRVYYTGEVKIDAQYMEQLKTKHSVFNKKLELSFPRGTVLMSAYPNSNGVYKYYTDNKLLFGIADPKDGVVGRRDDKGLIIGSAGSQISIPNYLVASFNSAVTTGNFSRISDIYWISGGMGELGDKGTGGYKPATSGLPPYSREGNFATSDFEPERKVVPSQRGTLKISFDENVVDDAAHTVTVFRYTDRGYWENIGGEVDTKNHTITVPFDEFGYYMVMKLKRSYSDINNHPWARNVLNGMYAKGVMNNLRYDEFGADDLTTRGEFVTLLVKGLNLPLKYDDNNTFNDIQPGTSTTTWSYEYIETAARAGIVQGKAVGYFGSEIPITREEAAVMIARALELKMAANDKKLEDSLKKTFLDGSKINTYARPAVDAVYKAKIMTGSEVTIPGSDKKGLNFNPTSNMTRAEAGAIAVRMFQRSTNLFPKTLG